MSVKKGQFLSPEETKNILDKGHEAGNDRMFITERGSSFGYQNLVVDMRAFPIIQEFGAPVQLSPTAHTVARRTDAEVQQ